MPIEPVEASAGIWHVPLKPSVENYVKETRIQLKCQVGFPDCTHKEHVVQHVQYHAIVL